MVLVFVKSIKFIIFDIIHYVEEEENALIGSNGKPVLVVQFLSGGKFTSKTGIAYKVADNLERVTARDSQKISISRAPENLKVIKFSTTRV